MRIQKHFPRFVVARTAGEMNILGGAGDGTQKHLIYGQDVIARDYGFEKIEEIWQAHRRKELEKPGYPKCYVCNILKPGPVYLYLQKSYRLFWDNGVRT